MTEIRTPADQPVRERIERELDRTFLVQAGAGSGKTHSLARRIAAGIAGGTYRIEQVTAVTFTRKAAAELRGRLQIALEERLKGGRPTTDERDRVHRALSNIERFFAGTIHSFCGHLLRERPVEARVAPGFVELDDVEDQRRRGQAWREYIARERGRGSSLMAELQAAKVKPADLDHAFAVVCDHDEVAFPTGDVTPPDAGSTWQALDRFCMALAAELPDPMDRGTKCKVQLLAVDIRSRLGVAQRTRPGALAELLTLCGGEFTTTKKWWGDGRSRGNRVAARVDTLLDEFRRDVVEPWLTRWRAYVYRLAMTALLAARETYRGERRRDNVVNYTDLLSATATLLRSNPAVRQAMQQKYRWILVDEFQDTDPIQAEVLALLAADEASIAKPSEADWSTVRLRPGALFVVGDPKQSIYRFRRADIDIYNTVRRLVEASGGEVLSLTACWRSLPEVCDLANTVFPGRFPPAPTAEAPGFEKLEPVRPSLGKRKASAPAGVVRLTIPASVPGKLVEQAEAARIAAFIQAEVAAGRRRFGDFLILARGRPRLGIYSSALQQLQIPVEVSGAGMFLESEHVASLCLLLTALSDPLDAVTLVGVLRGPLFGISDRELFAYHEAGGRFELTAPIGGETEPRPRVERAQAALRTLQRLYRLTRTLPPGAAVDQILDETGFLALASTSASGAAAGDLLQAIDRVRQVTELRGSLVEAADALQEDAPLSTEIESLPLEPGRQDVVRIMNLHRVKGLEAPVVFLADPCHGFVFPPEVRIVREGLQSRGFMKIEWRSEEKENYARRLIGMPVDWSAHEAVEQRYRDAEVTRLLYVAATRARDLLVVGQWEKASRNGAWDEFALFLSTCPELPFPQAPPQPAPPMPDVSPELRAQASAARHARTSHLRQPSWAITRVTDEAHEHGQSTRIRGELADEPVVPASAGPDDSSLLQETAGQRTDAGYAWGLLIHGLLEHAMRHRAASRADLERLGLWLTVETPDLRPHIPHAVDVVQGVSKAAFWQEANAAAERHVEVPYAATRLDASGVPTIVRGVIDLVYRSPDAWRILDYKTDRVDDEASLLAKYGGQIAQYVDAWTNVTTTARPIGALYSVRAGRVIATETEG